MSSNKWLSQLPKEILQSPNLMCAGSHMAVDQNTHLGSSDGWELDKMHYYAASLAPMFTVMKCLVPDFNIFHMDVVFYEYNIFPSCPMPDMEACPIAS